MANYKDISGLKIKSVSSDPSNLNEGEMWYNSTSGSLKVAPFVAGTWSSGGTIPQIVRGGGSGGVQTASWIAGGLQYPGDTKNKAWTYDGSSWSSAEDIPANYFVGGSCGPATAGLLWDGIGSYGPGTATYEWDGTNWTAGGSLPAIGPGGSQADSGAGVGQTAAVALGGIGDPPPATSDRMMAYNGSSWSTDESMPAGRAGASSDGPNTAIWAAGGPGTDSTSIEYDGSSWTASGATVYAMPGTSSGNGWGPQTSAIIGGGSNSTPTATQSQLYNGTSWTSGTNMSVARNNAAMSTKTAGSQTGFICGGYSSTANTDATEEWDAAAVAAQTVTVS